MTSESQSKKGVDINHPESGEHTEVTRNQTVNKNVYVTAPRRGFMHSDNILMNWTTAGLLLSFVLIGFGMVSSLYATNQELLSLGALTATSLVGSSSFIDVPTSNITASRDFYVNFLGGEEITAGDSQAKLSSRPQFESLESVPSYSMIALGPTVVTLVDTPSTAVLHPPSFALALPRFNGEKPPSNPKREQQFASVLAFSAAQIMQDKYVSLVAGGHLDAQQVHCELLQQRVSEEEPSGVLEWIPLVDFVSPLVKEPAQPAEGAQKRGHSPFVFRSLRFVFKGLDNILRHMGMSIFGDETGDAEKELANRLANVRANEKAAANLTQFEVWCRGPSGEWVGLQQFSPAHHALASAADRWVAGAQQRRAAVLRRQRMPPQGAKGGKRGGARDEL